MTELITADRLDRPAPASAPKKIGRPIIGREKMAAWPRIGMTESQHKKLMENGGAKWLRGLIDEAKV